MSFDLTGWFGRQAALKTTILLSVVFFFGAATHDVSAQRRSFSRSYPTGHLVRLTLTNKTGTVTVIGWDRPEINISATLEAPSAVIAPQNLSGEIVINLIRDNSNRDVGSVNFTIRVPYTTQVDIQTLMGNLIVSNIRSAFVRARVSTDGDIELTNIGSGAVVAENGIGNIFYDGELQESGTYRFSSMQGTINLHIPFNSSFKLIATAPSTRNIMLGPFNNGDMNLGDGRRVFGKYGSGSASLTVTNQRGSIFFVRR